MSASKPVALTDFYRSIRARFGSSDALAQEIGVSGAVLRRVLGGWRRPGRVWRKLLPLLTLREIALLTVVQSSTWNAERAAKRPAWTPEKATKLATTSTDFPHEK